MGRAVPALEVSAEERGELERLIRTHGTAQQIALRARMILLSAEGLKIGEITARLGVWRKTVSQWRKRWRSGPDTSAEARKRLSDAPRSGHRQGSSRSKLAPSLPWPVRRLKAAACLSPIGASGRSPKSR